MFLSLEYIMFAQPISHGEKKGKQKGRHAWFWNAARSSGRFSFSRGEASSDFGAAAAPLYPARLGRIRTLSQKT